MATGSRERIQGQDLQCLLTAFAHLQVWNNHVSQLYQPGVRSYPGGILEALVISERGVEERRHIWDPRAIITFSDILCMLRETRAIGNAAPCNAGHSAIPVTKSSAPLIVLDRP
jgi:hypothetical protein